MCKNSTLKHILSTFYVVSHLTHAQVANFAREFVLMGKAGCNIPANRIENTDKKKAKARKAAARNAGGGTGGPIDALDMDMELKADHDHERDQVDDAEGGAGNPDDAGGQFGDLMMDLGSESGGEGERVLGGDSDEDPGGQARSVRAKKHTRKARTADEDVVPIDVEEPLAAAGRRTRTRKVPRRFREESSAASDSDHEQDPAAEDPDQDPGRRSGRAPKGPSRKDQAAEVRRLARETYLINHARFTDALMSFKMPPQDVFLSNSRFLTLCDVAPPETFERNKLPRQHTMTVKSAVWKRYVRFDGDVFCLRGVYPPQVLKCLSRINGVIRLSMHGDHNRVVPSGLGLAAVRAVAEYERIIPPTEKLLQNHMLIHMVTLSCDAMLRLSPFMCILCAFFVHFM